MNPLIEGTEGEASVRLARWRVENELKDPELPRPDSVPEEERGVFVTLKSRGDLRGCMGIPRPEKPLDRAVREAAGNAAFDDPRFPPLTSEETDIVTFEVTVLTPPREIAPEEVEVGVHGLILESRGRAGLLLPQVPEEQGWSREEYLRGVAQKAGLRPEAWRDASLKGFRGQVFKEREPRGEVEEV